MLNTEYWNNEGVQKIFTHPICAEWIANLDRKATILDLGCGYGRLTTDLRKEGLLNIFGYDSSAPLIERAVLENPGAFYTSNIIDLSGKVFDLILCFALFTSCPSSDEQRGLILLVNKLSHENSLLYISDYETLDNPNYRERYEQQKLNTYGCFTSENAIFRHHESGHFDCLLPNWKRLEERRFSSKTLNGNDITVHQYLYVKGKG
jgi:SAM-dependent methyltransferase